MRSAIVSFCSTSRIEMPRPAIWLSRIGDALDHLRRKAFGRLVDHDEIGVPHQCAADREHLLLAAGKDARRRVAAFSQDREELVGVLHAPARRLAAGLDAEHEILLDRERSEDVAVLRHVADPEWAIS